MTTPTQEDKIKAIYEKIPTESTMVYCIKSKWGTKQEIEPIRIWDALEYIYRVYVDYEEREEIVLELFALWFENWLHKPLPLEWWTEREDIVEYLYNLIK